MTDTYRHVPIVNILKVAGLNPDLSVNMAIRQTSPISARLRMTRMNTWPSRWPW